MWLRIEALVTFYLRFRVRFLFHIVLLLYANIGHRWLHRRLFQRLLRHHIIVWTFGYPILAIPLLNEQVYRSPTIAPLATVDAIAWQTVILLLLGINNPIFRAVYGNPTFTEVLSGQLCSRWLQILVANVFVFI